MRVTFQPTPYTATLKKLPSHGRKFTKPAFASKSRPVSRVLVQGIKSHPKAVMNYIRLRTKGVRAFLNKDKNGYQITVPKEPKKP